MPFRLVQVFVMKLTILRLTTLREVFGAFCHELRQPLHVINMAAQVIQKRGTVYDLAKLEHAYAPPFSSAKDPMNMAGFVAENILDYQSPIGKEGREFQNISIIPNN